MRGRREKVKGKWERKVGKKWELEGEMIKSPANLFL